MNIALHKRARTTPAVRREIQRSELSERKLSEKYGIGGSTVRKWKYRDTAEDFSHRPHNLNATLTASEDAVVVEPRETLLLPIDDLLVLCVNLSVRTCRAPRRPQTNGMVERFNGGVSEIIDRTGFESSKEIKETLMRSSLKNWYTI